MATSDLPTTAYGLDGYITEREGFRFRINIETDNHYGAPWEEEDGHGPVSAWTTRDKKPGERVLCEDRRSKRYYDFAEAVRIARADGWDAEPIGTGTRKQQAARAAEADFKHLRAWCNDDWHYCGVVVTPLPEDPDDDPRKNDYLHALWGIEDNAGDYLAEVAEELIRDALITLRKEADEAAEEAAEEAIEEAARIAHVSIIASLTVTFGEVRT